MNDGEIVAGIQFSPLYLFVWKSKLDPGIPDPSVSEIKTGFRLIWTPGILVCLTNGRAGMGSFKHGMGGRVWGFGLGAPLQHVKCDKLRRHLTLDVSMSHGNLEFTRLIQPFFNIFFPDFWELTFGNSKSPDSVFASFSTCFSAYAFPFRFLAYMAQGFLAKLPPHTWHRPGLEISSNTSPIPTVFQNS